jgi:hypothetical protein
MKTQPTRFSFTRDINMAEVKDTLQLSRMATESLYGFSRVDLDAVCCLCPRRRTVSIDGSTDVGKTLLLIFHGFVRREFATSSVKVTSGPSKRAFLAKVNS